MTDAPKLKPCPFCGGEMEDRGYGAMHAVGEGCPLQDLAFDPVKWNTRHTPPEVQAIVDALIKCRDKLDDYSRFMFPLDHPVHKRRRKIDYDANPARAALTNWEAMTSE